MELTPGAAKSYTLPVVDDGMTITANEVPRLLESTIKTGIQTGPLNGADFVVETQYRTPLAGCHGPPFFVSCPK